MQFLVHSVLLSGLSHMEEGRGGGRGGDGLGAAGAASLTKAPVNRLEALLLNLELELPLTCTL